MLRAPSTMGSAAALFCALVGLLALPTGVNARAPGVKTLTAVEFSAADEYVEFTLRADPPLDPAAISARKDGRVLMIRADGARTDRRWLDTADGLIKRTLLHPSRKHAPAAVVRTRLTRTVSPEMLANIRVRLEGDAVVVAVPRSAQVARRWARSPAVVAAAAEPAAAAPAGAIKLTFAPAEAAPVGATEPADAPATPDDALSPPPAIAAVESPVAPTAEEAAEADDALALAAAPLDPADTPLGLDDTTPLGADDAALSAGLASAAGPGVGAFLMSLLFLGAVGFLMWRKMRGNRMTQSGRPIIRPVGSHMLGPKQSLLLVDVAGEMVLLGTTDKGVQMLTKIEGRDEPAAAQQRVAEAPAPAASFAERLGAAVSRFRTAAAQLDRGATDEAPEAPEAPRRAAREQAERDAERPYYAREQAAGREAAEEDALAALADRVEDEPQIDARRRARTRFAPVEPAPTRKPAAPPLDPTADLLRKIRSLQRA